MRLSLRGIAFVVGVLIAPVVTSAQPVRVSGVAFDSIGGRPVPFAFVTLGSRNTTADSLGRFVLDSASLGNQRLSMQHDLLDSLGLSGVSTMVTISGPTDALRVATPSKRTVWRRVCGGEAPSDSGIVFGVARAGATRATVPSATVVATWVELRSTGRAVSQKGWRLETATSSAGEFVICGMPLETVARLNVARDSSELASVDVVMSARSPIQRRDLLLSNLADSAAQGAVFGLVLADAVPVSNVRVQTDAGAETRTDANGRFRFLRVPAGTRQLYLQAIGIEPTTRVVDVAVRDTVHLTVSVGRTTLLDSVVIKAQTARTRQMEQFSDRRRTAIGYFRDSTELARFNTWSGVLNEMPRVQIQCAGCAVPRITLDRCTPEIWIDRQRVEPIDFGALRPQDVAAIEIYPPNKVPGELQVKGVSTPGRRGSSPCAIWVLTKRGVG